jgi:sedoheptulokinase
MKIVGLDIGTTTISGVLMDTTAGSCLDSMTVPNTAGLPAQAPWEDLQAPERLLEISQEILTRLSRGAGKLAGLGLTGQMHGILYVDSKGLAASPLYTWQDGRGDLAYQGGLSYAAYLSSLTGYPMATGFGLATHFYNLKHDLVPQEAQAICTIADYVAMRLCGLTAPVMHPSLAHSLGLFDLASGSFDAEALRDAEIPSEILPKVVSAEIQIGETPQGVPVCIPIGDNQASFLGAIQRGANVLVNIGTGAQLSALSEDILDLPALETRPYIRDAYLLVGSALCGGRAYSLLRDFFAQTLRSLGDVEPKNLYQKMESLGEAAYTGTTVLEVDTRFKGTRVDPDLRGAIRSLGLDNFTPGHLVIGFITGMSDELKAFYDRLPKDLRESDFIVGGGNAVRRNALLRRIISDRFGKPLRLAEYQEEAAVGAARLAGEILIGA